LNPKRIKKRIVIWLIAGAVIILITRLFRAQILFFLVVISELFPIYTNRGSVPIQSGDKIIAASVYTRQGAPYALVGPYPFPEQKDFFFVRKNEVVGRCLDDKVEGDFFRFFKWLVIGFDLSSNIDAWAPHFSFQAEIRHNSYGAKYDYRVNLAESGESPRVVFFSVDEKWLK